MDNIKRKQIEKSLDYIESIINRMASNSFKIKGWTITILSGLAALINYTKMIPIILLIPLTSLLMLDAYYLSIERDYRKLYEKARLNLLNNKFKYEPFNLKINNKECRIFKIIKALISGSILCFYPWLILFVFIYIKFL